MTTQTLIEDAALLAALHHLERIDARLAHMQDRRAAVAERFGHLQAAAITRTAFAERAAEILPEDCPVRPRDGEGQGPVPCRDGEGRTLREAIRDRLAQLDAAVVAATSGAHLLRRVQGCLENHISVTLTDMREVLKILG